MKLKSAIETGLAGATTISLLGETLRRIDGQNSHPNSMHKKSLEKRFKKASSKKPLKASKQVIGLAGDLLGNASLLGLGKLTKKKNAVLRGALLGTAAGLGVVWLNSGGNSKGGVNGHKGYPYTKTATDPLLAKALEVGLFALGGAIAGKLVKGEKKKKKK